MVIIALPIVILLHVLHVSLLFLRNVAVELEQQMFHVVKNSSVPKNVPNFVLVADTDVIVVVVMGNILHVPSYVYDILDN